MEREPIYKVQNLFKNYKTEFQSLSIFSGLNLNISKGSAICIVGASGSGKSTLLNILGALDHPTSGQVFYRNQNLFELKEEELAFFRGRKLGFVFQFHHLLAEFNVLENIFMPALLSGLPKKSSVERAHFLSETLGLKDRIKHYPSQLSGGEQQRVAVARALMNEPEILLADEPVGNLDRKNACRIRDLFFELHEKFHLTLVAVSHDLFFAEIFPSVLKLEEGQIKEFNAMR